MYEPRFYRCWAKNNFNQLEVVVEETDLLVLSDEALDEDLVKERVLHYRGQVNSYIEEYPDFAVSLSPVSVSASSPGIVEAMSENCSAAGVGPMAGIAGAIAEFVGRDLLNVCSNIIVENGGDIFAKADFPLTAGLYVGEESLFNKMSITIDKPGIPFGLCASSAKLGHSLSFGSADLAVVLAESAVFADALATKLVNMTKSPKDISKVIEFAKKFPETLGVVLCVEDKAGFWGDIKINSH